MSKLIGAYTTMAEIYPGYINVSQEDDGTVVVTMRGDPAKRDGAYVCGHASDKGKPGRCTPGDAHCNNYCNLAPQKGPMVDAPKPCTQTFSGETVSVRLTAAEWAALLTELSKGN
ncbi:hypothetical protein [Arvimicrobium flavum]|uniref:hypothetical protein n=1 Tax=Arvimicrobium flavum TaxID=3393320 RepID=UPI00237A1A8E|nr:hypothetical protein [Mesorhizobium shangrilense]